jgi:glc operon protein GlcG
MLRISHLTVAALTAFVVAAAQQASAQSPIPYGESISLADAKKVLAAAEEEATKNKWPVAIAIVDPSGHLLAFSRLENTQLGSIEVALQKAKTSVYIRRPTKAFEEMVAAGEGGLKILNLPGAIPIEGGLPIVVGGKIVGAIGVSGVKSTEDAVIAVAGMKAVMKTEP